MENAVWQEETIKMSGSRKKERKTFKDQLALIKRLIVLYEEKLDQILINQNIIAYKLGIDLELEKNNAILSLFGSDDENDQETAKKLESAVFKTFQEKIDRLKLFGRI